MLVNMANYYPEGWCTPAKWENVQRKPCIFILNPLGVEGTMILSSSVDLAPLVMRPSTDRIKPIPCDPSHPSKRE